MDWWTQHPCSLFQMHSNQWSSQMSTSHDIHSQPLHSPVPLNDPCTLSLRYHSETTELMSMGSQIVLSQLSHVLANRLRCDFIDISSIDETRASNHAHSQPSHPVPIHRLSHLHRQTFIHHSQTAEFISTRVSNCGFHYHTS